LAPEKTIKDFLSRKTISRTEKLLIILSLNSEKPKEIKEIKQLGIEYGLKEAQSWNIASILDRANGLVIKTPNGWELTLTGTKRVSSLIGPLEGGIVPQINNSLLLHLNQIQNTNTKKFVEEAIHCFELRLYRSAVVLSWIGAMAVLYDFVIARKLTEFNTEAIRRNSKWKPAKNADDFARMSESDFLDILESISVLGKSVKHELQGCLKLRNGCGHPNSLIIAENRVAAHIESLILNVFSKFS
jgi:hypothetical protein